MSDEQILEILERIHDRCGSNRKCSQCKFEIMLSDGSFMCQIMRLGNLISNYPDCWDMWEIRRALEK